MEFQKRKSAVGSILSDIHTYRRAYILTVITSFGGMLFGWDTGLIGGVLSMKAFQESFNLNKKSKSFANLSGNIVSVLQAGCFFGAASSFYISDKFGRRIALLIAATIFLVGSTIQTCSGLANSDLSILYVGRFIGGFGVGLVSAVVPTYVGENANKEIRGRCIGCMQLFNVTGIMLSFFINYGCNQNIPGNPSRKWRIPFALQMIPGVILFLGLLTQNESPRWLVEKSRTEDALHALSRVRAKSPDDPSVQRELEEIVVDFRNQERLSLPQQIKSAYSSKSNLYRCSFAVILMFFQQWTGTNSINYYAPQIFASIGLKGTSAGLFATGIYGVVKVTVTALGLMFAMEQVGRKWSLIVGGLGQAFAMYYIGIHSAISPTVTSTAASSASAPLTPAGTFAIVCVYLFVVFYSFGWGPTPFVLAAECSPNHLRSLVMALALMTQWLFNFIIAKITPIMLANIKFGTFLLFGSMCVVMTVYAVVCVPETKGVPLESVHRLFEGRIVRGALRDVVPRFARAKGLKGHSAVDDADDEVVQGRGGLGGARDVEKKGDEMVHVEEARG